MILQKMIQTRHKSQGYSIGRVLPFAAITKWWNDLVAITISAKLVIKFTQPHHVQLHIVCCCGPDSHAGSS